MTIEDDIPPARVLIAEDDADIRALIVAQLRHEPYAVVAVASIAEVLATLAEGGADLLVLDLNLPDGDGLDLCRQLRGEGFTGAIVMVTARDAADDRVLGLELGADDYLTKPFEPRELLARIRNWLKRVKGSAEHGPRGARFAFFGSWRLDMLQRRLIAPDDMLVMLSGAEFRMLRRFLEAPGRVLSREELSPERSATVAFDRTTDIQVSRLRQKLAAIASQDALILTVRNEGYVFPGPVRFE